MRKFWIVVSLAVIAVFVTSVLPTLSLAGARPDLFLMFALAAALTGRGKRALWMAWSAGLAKDVLSDGPFGAHAALFLLIAVAVIGARQYFAVEMVGVQIAFAAAACLACNALYFIVAFVYHPDIGVAGPLGYIAVATLLTAGLMPLAMILAGGAVRYMALAPRIGRRV